MTPRESAIPASSALLESLIVAVRESIREGGEDTALSTRVASTLAEARLFLAEPTDPAGIRRRRYPLHLEPDASFSIDLLVLQSGQETAIHDHFSWCVIGVFEGQITESRYRLVREGYRARLVRSGDAVLRPGTVTASSPPGDIHRLTNQAAEPAISLHIYRPDPIRPANSIRRRFDLPIAESIATGQPPFHHRAVGSGLVPDHHPAPMRNDVP